MKRDTAELAPSVPTLAEIATLESRLEQLGDELDSALLAGRSTAAIRSEIEKGREDLDGAVRSRAAAELSTWRDLENRIDQLGLESARRAAARLKAVLADIEAPRKPARN